MYCDVSSVHCAVRCAALGGVTVLNRNAIIIQPLAYVVQELPVNVAFPIMIIAFL